MPLGKEWEKEIDLQISPHLSPLPSSDFSPYDDLSPRAAEIGRITLVLVLRFVQK